MKEIGGYLSFPLYKGKMLYQRGILLNNARNCLELIIKVKKIKKIYLPTYICDSVLNVCIKNEVKTETYLIDKLFNPIIKDIPENSYVLLVNYYGQLQNKTIRRLKNHYNLIIDNTQSYFSKPIDNIPTIYSCRKYFGVPDGGILVNFKLSNSELHFKRETSECFAEHLIGRLEQNASKFFQKFKENEIRLDNANLKGMSRFTENILHSIDYRFAKSRRERNFKLFENEFKEYNLISTKQEGTFAYPLMIEKGALVREELIKSQIYIPVLWPNCLNKQCFIDPSLDVNNLLILPIYEELDTKDIKKIITIIKEKIR